MYLVTLVSEQTEYIDYTPKLNVQKETYYLKQLKNNSETAFGITIGIFHKIQKSKIWR